nr:NADH dehydrogenase subunit 6 [Monoclona rufilatera]
MLQFIINSYIMMFSFMFSQMKHPLTLGFMLLMQTFFVSMSIGLNFKTFWFSYILFLVMLGGMLVLFIYVISLSSNEMFSISTKLLLILFIFSFFIFFTFMLIDYFYINNLKNLETIKLMEFNSYLKENMLDLKKIYNYPINMITILLIMYLFFTLVVTVKITNFFYGPLRMMY